MKVRLIIDPNPCNRYRWPAKRPCHGVHSGAHLCDRGGGHPGACRCAQCGKLGKGPDIADHPTAPP